MKIKITPNQWLSLKISCLIGLIIPLIGWLEMTLGKSYVSKLSLPTIQHFNDALLGYGKSMMAGLAVIELLLALSPFICVIFLSIKKLAKK